MLTIIVEKDNQISEYLARIESIQGETYASASELLASPSAKGQIVIVKSDDNPIPLLQQVCDFSLFTIFITDRPNDVVSPKAYSLPVSAKKELILGTIQAVLENIQTKSQGQGVSPLPRPKYDDSIYLSLRADMVKDAQQRAQTVANYNNQTSSTQP